MNHEAVNSAAETPDINAWDQLNDRSETSEPNFEETPIENDFAEEFTAETPVETAVEHSIDVAEAEPEIEAEAETESEPESETSVEQVDSPETEAKIEPLQADIDAIERYGQKALENVVSDWTEKLEKQKSALSAKQEIADKALAEVAEIQKEYDETSLHIAQLQAALDFVAEKSKPVETETESEPAPEAEPEEEYPELEGPRLSSNAKNNSAKQEYVHPSGFTYSATPEEHNATMKDFLKDNF